MRRRNPSLTEAWTNQPYRSVDVDYPQLLKQVLWDTYFGRTPEAFLVLCAGVPHTAFGPLGASKPQRFTPTQETFEVLSEFKGLLEAYERILSRVRPDGDARNIHHDIEYCVRAAILGLGKARNGDMKGAMGYWKKTRDFWDISRSKLLNLEERGSPLAEWIDIDQIVEAQSVFAYANPAFWPPRLR